MNNQLKHEKSPYLKQHEKNPVNWLAWNKETLSIAKKELLAANKNNEEICKYINAKSLKFLSIDGMYRAMGFKKRI